MSLSILVGILKGPVPLDSFSFATSISVALGWEEIKAVVWLGFWKLVRCS